MGASGGHHYTIEINPSREAPGCFRWMVRDRGKLLCGSYRPHSSEAAARATAERAVLILSSTGAGSG